MKLTRSAKWGFVTLILLVMVFTGIRVKARSDYRLLQEQLGTKDDPIRFQADAITPGMSREEVHSKIRGYARLVSLDIVASPLGETELFVFEFGPQLPFWRSEYASIVVTYADNRVKDKATVDYD